MSHTTAPSAKPTVATLFAGPGSASNSSASVSENVAFRFVLDRTVQTLSSSGVPDSGALSGLLFVPDLAPHDPCNAIIDPFIPSNVTRHADVSKFGYSLIGLAPWVSSDCTQSFLAASRQAGTEALIFYQPFSNETQIPPPPSDKRWDLNDGDQWRTDNNYPIYAIPGPAGKTLMHELSWFSEGVSANKSQNESHPSMQSANQSARLFTMIDAENPTSSTPALWSFVLAILGTIVGLCLALLIVYRCVQRSRRERLRQRIAAGEVDIEQLALTQLTVPRDVVEKMPLYTFPQLALTSDVTVTKGETQEYVAEIESSDKSPAPPPPNDEHESTLDDSGIRKPEAAVIKPQPDERSKTRTNTYRLSYTQTTCAICLDDFAVGSSMVRELPCGHIFDPECIDPFLMENSSLCPLCKKSVLPPGSYQLQVTNAMVRQEQTAREPR